MFTILVDPIMGIRQAHQVSQHVEEMICQKIRRCVVQVHYEPDGEQIVFVEFTY